MLSFAVAQEDLCLHRAARFALRTSEKGLHFNTRRVARYMSDGRHGGVCVPVTMWTQRDMHVRRVRYELCAWVPVACDEGERPFVASQRMRARLVSSCARVSGSVTSQRVGASLGWSMYQIFPCERDTIAHARVCVHIDTPSALSLSRSLRSSAARRLRRQTGEFGKKCWSA